MSWERDLMSWERDIMSWERDLKSWERDKYFFSHVPSVLPYEEDLFVMLMPSHSR